MSAQRAQAAETRCRFRNPNVEGVATVADHLEWRAAVARLTDKRLALELLAYSERLRRLTHLLESDINRAQRRQRLRLERQQELARDPANRDAQWDEYERQERDLDRRNPHPEPIEPPKKNREWWEED